MATHREASRQDWRTKDPATIQEIDSGSLQRIADATEKMASNYTALQNDLAMYKRWYENELRQSGRLARSNAALRGHIGRMKRAQS